MRAYLDRYLPCLLRLIRWVFMLSVGITGLSLLLTPIVYGLLDEKSIAILFAYFHFYTFIFALIPGAIALALMAIYRKWYHQSVWPFLGKTMLWLSAAVLGYGLFIGMVVWLNG
ncbi:MAG: hypothetical protein ACFB10_00700 [Salibacteraceae bacterium]